MAINSMSLRKRRKGMQTGDRNVEISKSVIRPAATPGTVNLDKEVGIREAGSLGSAKRVEYGSIVKRG